MIISSKKTPIIFAFVLLAGLQLSSSSSIENELLTVRLDNLQSQMDQLIIQLEEERNWRKNLQTLNSQLEIRIDKQDEEIRLLKDRINDDQFIKPFKTDADPADIHQDFKSDSSPRLLPPSSCRQLSTIGHNLNGIYLIANPDTNKIEAVYCEFGSSSVSEILYGNIEVKRRSIYFYVQRVSDFGVTNVVLPYELERLNVGGAMNAGTGVFTAPVNGIYHFEFSSMKLDNGSKAFVHLQVNGVTVATSYATALPNFLSLSSINAYLHLKAGDQVRMYKNEGTLRDDYRHTQFAGQLVEEDLVLG